MVCFGKGAGAFSSSEIWSVSSDPEVLGGQLHAYTSPCQPIHLPPTRWKLPASSEMLKKRADLSLLSSSLLLLLLLLLPSPLLLSPWSCLGTLWMSGLTSYKQQGRGSFERWGCVTLASCRWLKYAHVNKWCLKSLEYSAQLLSKKKEKTGGLCGYFSG